MATQASALPELAEVWWRSRASERSLHRSEQLWTAITAAHVVPFIAVAGVLLALKPLLAPIAVIALIHAWAIPELYAARGANVLRERSGGDDPGAERIARGLLSDLLNHAPRELLARTGVVLEQGELGAWLLGESGAVLVRPGGRLVHCYCVKATQGDLPPSDRMAHLLLALRSDEAGFATLANLAFAGARWRLARRLDNDGREALAAAAVAARRI